MENSPGIQNFMKKTNTLKDGIENLGEKPKSIFDFLGESLGFDVDKDNPESTQDALNQFGLTKEQLARMQQYSSPDSPYNFTGQFNINDDMRRRFNR
jgi:hypothetical protein